MNTIRSWVRNKFTRNFRLETDTLQSIQLIAANERRTPEEIADQIIVNALLEQQAQEENYQCWQTLTRREKEVAALICMDCTNREISEKLGIAQPTVKSHVTHILSKFNVSDRDALRYLLKGWDFSGWER